MRKFFKDVYNVEPVIINGDQMPLHRNESCSQKTLNLKNQDVFVKENYMLSRERITFFSQISTDENMELGMEFVFKGKGICVYHHYHTFYQISVERFYLKSP